MKVSRETARRNRAEVVKSASRAFRETGIEGSGIATIMKSAGLTHGGFYARFGSKEDLVAEAITEACASSLGRWERALARAPQSDAQSDPLAAVAALYLSPAHRDQPGDGCVLAALAADAARGGPPLRKAMAAGIEALTATLTSHNLSRAEALNALSLMVGALTLARASANANASADADSDQALSIALLDAARAALGAAPTTPETNRNGAA